MEITFNMDELVETVKNLKLSSENGKTLIMQIDTLIKLLSDNDDKSKFCEKVVDDKLLGSLTQILYNGNVKEKAKAAEFLAELAKVEECRLSSVLNGVAPLIVNLLDSEDLGITLQACRALGNICYEYDGGRMCVTECGALKKLVALMYRILKLPKNQEVHHLKLISTGFLLNILNSYEIVKKLPEHLDIIKMLLVYLDECIDDDDIITHILLSISSIVDYDVDECESIVNSFTPSLIKVLNHSWNLEVMESCIELFSAISQNEYFRILLVQHGTMEAVMNVVRKLRDNYDTENSHSLLKVASDLIVLILIGDESMNLLYDKGKGTVYRELIEWLSSDVMNLKIAGSLAIGNFARSDENCNQMVDQGISCLLLEVLSKHSKNDDNMFIQHSILAALRNLAISKENKPILINQGCLEILLPMIQTTDSYPVVFKLLGTIRMLVDGQKEIASRICRSKEILEKLVNLTAVSSTPGVQAEATRILSWIVLSGDEIVRVLKAYMTNGALAPIINMLGSQHQIMQWEASASLRKLVIDNADDELIEILKDLKFIEKCIHLIKQTIDRNDKPSNQIFFNIFSIIQYLSGTECGLKLLKNEELVRFLEEWFSTSYDSSICPDGNLLNVIKEGIKLLA